MENKCYIGIDPGNLGFIAVQVNNEWVHMSLKDNDFYQISDTISYLKAKYPNIVAGLEQVHAIFGSSANYRHCLLFIKSLIILLRLKLGKANYGIPVIWL